ncbi:MAG: phosphatidylinositol-specific phospholipase C1-like protein [Bacteroidota bacterium]
MCKNWIIILLPLWILPIQGCDLPESSAQGTSTPVVRLNHIQMLASHNSYKEAIEPALFSRLMEEDSSRFFGLEYHHISLKDQLDLGIRKLEVDIVYDPEGGRYAKPLGLSMLADMGVETQPYDPDKLMEQPGFKVLHVQDIDFRSNCLTLEACLGEILAWSEAHPNHLPIAISFNAKDSRIERPGFVLPLPFTSTAFDSLDQALLSVLPKNKLLTPDEVRGDYTSLEEAVLSRGWPQLDAVRGKILFVLDEGGKKLEAYVAGHPSLENRVMFVNAQPGRPEAAFLIMNNPIRDHDLIQERVKLGYLVRTRADANTIEARRNDYSRFEAALSSGAHYITTDYYVPNPAFGTDYQISFPAGKIALCNPLYQDVCKNMIIE